MFGRLHLITIGFEKTYTLMMNPWNPKNQNGGLDDSIVRTSIGWFLGSSMVPAVNFQGCKVRLAEVGFWFAQIDLTKVFFFDQASKRHVGLFNPSEKYQSNWIISPSRGRKKSYLKPPPVTYIDLRGTLWKKYHRFLGGKMALDTRSPRTPRSSELSSKIQVTCRWCQCLTTFRPRCL